MRRRVGIPYVMVIAERLTVRDWAVLDSLFRCRLATGRQLERLHFAELRGESQHVVRRRVLRRLVGLRAIQILLRPSGYQGAPASPVYQLDTAGDTLMRLRRDPKNLHPRRRPGPPGDRFIAHVLDVTELYVQATEAERRERFQLRAFHDEPASWWRTENGTTLKPDAFVRVGNGEFTDSWWIEVDRATESVRSVADKLRAYARFADSGARGPDGALPAVLITTPSPERARALHTGAIPTGDHSIEFHTVAFPDAIATIAATLHS